MLKRRQKGQSVLEFAFMLPLLLLIMLGIISFGLYFSDYIALSHIARSSAREASMKTDEEGWNDIRARYASVAAAEGGNVNTYYLPNSSYTWNPSDKNQFDIKATGANQDMIVVTLTAPINDVGPIHALASFMHDSTFINQIKVDYRMFWAKKEKNDDEDETSTEE